MARGRVYKTRESLEARIASLKEELPPDQVKALLRFKRSLQAQGLSDHRLLFYLQHLMPVARRLGEVFLRPEKEDIEVVVAAINASDYKEWTKVSKRVAIKRFYKWLLGEDEEYPRCVRWIKSKANNHKRKLPEDMLTEGEVKAMVQACLNPRDRALISLLYDSGARIGEILSLDVKHVEFDQYGAVVHIPEGKTGSRRVRVIGNSVAHLPAWLEVHPIQDDRNAPLFVGLDARTRDRSMNYPQARKVIQTAARRGGVEKRVTPHLFRHTRATELAKRIPEAPLEAYMGWVPGSEMAQVYVHLSGRDVDDAILEGYGLKEREETLGTLPIECPRCKAKTASDGSFCRRCGLPLGEGVTLQTLYETNISGDKMSAGAWVGPDSPGTTNEEKLEAFVRKMILEDPELREALRE